MARDASRLARLAPEFVRDLYVAAFGWQETSDDQTFLFQSRLNGFLSNRAQDYKHARWELAQRATGGSWKRRRPPQCKPSSRSLKASAGCITVPALRWFHFDLAGLTTGIREDHSHIWDTGWGMDENAHAILNQFFHDLQECLEDPERAEFTTALVRYFIAGARDAVLWRRLLDLAARFPALAQQT